LILLIPELQSEELNAYFKGEDPSIGEATSANHPPFADLTSLSARMKKRKSRRASLDWERPCPDYPEG